MVKLSSGIDLNPNELTSEDREAIVKALEETKSGVWKPDPGDAYWYIKELGYVSYEYWSENEEGDTMDKALYSMGGFFRTKEAAEKHLTYLKALQVLRGDTKGYEYKPGDEYYQGWWNIDEEELGFDCWTVIVSEGIKFKTRTDIRDSFKAHEKEWRIVLGIE